MRERNTQSDEKERERDKWQKGRDGLGSFNVTLKQVCAIFCGYRVS